MTDIKQKSAAKEFADYWKDRGYEKGESQKFWLSLLGDVLEVKCPTQFIRFEDKVVLDHTSFIDGIIPTTHVLIEQKSADKDLRKEIKQSDGRLMTPFQQAKRYSAELSYSERPRWIVTCNFQEFLIYDMEKPTSEPESILLKDLPKEYYRLNFLVDKCNDNIKREMEISVKAGELVGVLYDEILKQYKDSANPESLKSLNMLCVRLVFCLYAEDAGIFGGHTKFHDYIKNVAEKDVKAVRRALIDLFKVLDTKPEDRDPYDDSMLSTFPYVNGGLFEKEDIEIPQFNENIVDLLLQKASEDFDWSEISPTIFGAVFESTLNPETRRTGGMHYTSIENIHKVIDPLFLDELNDELDTILEIKVKKTRNAKLEEYREKLSDLIFLDPACGSGNFLTETYISLRRLENKVLEVINKGQIKFEFIDPIKVGINQFYGIEINDFAVTVAKTALWIAESQMMKETSEIVKQNIEFLPLRSYANIVEGNALRMDWESVVPKTELNYIMGNPPFVGAKLTDDSQRKDKEYILGDMGGKLDYVACWFKKASDFIIDSNITFAFVATNSIVQGEQPVLLFKPILENNLEIVFAHRTFRWDSESNLKAHVHCVIIAVGQKNRNFTKIIFSNGNKQIVNNINAYLLNAPNIYFDKIRKPICNVPSMTKGSQLIDGGNFILGNVIDMQEFIRANPEATPYVYEYCNADSYINNREKTYCLFLNNCPPSVIKHCKGIYERVNAVYEYRKNSEAKSTHDLMHRPTEYFIANIPKNDSILIPIVSSERRQYIPIGFLSSGIVYTNATNFIDQANLYHFGVLISFVHNAWMRVLCGRLKSDYRYSKDIVYNNFPWCEPTEDQKMRIEQTAQAILDARALYPESSLADLYDELSMPPELRKAHQQNDKAVMKAYGFPVNMTESECVAELMKIYMELTGK